MFISCPLNLAIDQQHHSESPEHISSIIIFIAHHRRTQPQLIPRLPDYSGGKMFLIDINMVICFNTYNMVSY